MTRATVKEKISSKESFEVGYCVCLLFLRIGSHSDQARNFLPVQFPRISLALARIIFL